MKQPDALIYLLLDRTADFGDRDDAAIDLAKFESAQVKEALLTIASDESEDPDLRDTCQDSLFEIEARMNKKE